jgi:hypothetical protein
MKKDPEDLAVVPPEIIARKIYLIRGHKVMLDRTLADLYEVPTKSLNLAVRRNQDRFPADFMFQLTAEEAQARGAPVPALCFHRARRSNALIRPSQQTRRAHEHRHYSRIREAPRDPRCTQRPSPRN